MSDLENFIQISDALIQFNAEVCGESLTGASFHSLEVHREELKEIWSRVKPKYEACLKELRHSADESAKNDLETVMARYQTTYHTYVRSVAHLGECIEEWRSSRSSVQSDTGVSSRQTYHPSIHLPPCDTEPFSGDYMQWPTFRDLFTAIYINNSRLSPVEKLFHLNNKTQGEAREVVRKAPLTNEGFEVAWKALQCRFENKRLLINSQLRALFNLEKSSAESGNSIKQVQSSINSVISALKLYDVDISSWDPIFVYICCTRLSETTLSLWEESLKSKTESPSWNQLDIFLTGRFQTLETVCDFTKTTLSDVSMEKAKTASNNQSPKRVNSYQNSIATAPCSLCPDQRHTIRLCPKFVSMVYVDRLFHIKKLKLCLNCFAKGHMVKDCKSAFNCMKCQQRHNTLLHKNLADIPTCENELQSTSKATPASSIISENTINSCTATNSNRVLLGTAVITIVHMGERFKARALFDSGSEASFISENLYNLLKLPSRPTFTQISGLNGATSARSQRICSFTLSSPHNSNIAIEVSAIVIPKLTSALPTFLSSREMFANLPNLPLADPEFYRTSYIDVLIGADLFPHVMLQGMENGVCGSLIAQETIFGWILTGPITLDTVSTFRTCVSYLNEVNMEKQISRFWEVEDLPRRKIMSEDERLCEDIYKKNTTRDCTGRYVVALPFKEHFSHSNSLGLSKHIAMAQYIRNENRLLKTPDFKEQYDRVLDEYIQLGHMKQITSFNSKSPNYYLPHHSVVKPDSATTKVRVVFNASNPTANGVSLNDVLHCGPALQRDLTLLLLDWRFFKIVFNSDIEKMYRQIRVDSKDTKFQRVLHRSSPEEEVHEYELQTVTFGVNCAPYLALRTMHQLAADVENIYPIASQIILSHMYVDDVLAGSHDVPSAIEAQVQLVKAMASAGFSLRKWTSNSEDFLKSTPQDHLLNREFLQFEDSSQAKTLGVRWNAKSDCFYFIVKEMKIVVNPTKRMVLSVICQLFDPAGWLCPFIVLAKLLMRDIWLTQIGWDDHLPKHLQMEWEEFQANYPLIERIRIPRWVNYYPNCEVQLHGFCDASEKAYAAVVYIRVQYPMGSIRTHLLNAKSRVSPLKVLSIPRLELCGAVLLAELIDALTQTLSQSISRVVCWTDSTIVLAWLKKPAFHWKTFVANRVARISEIVDVNHWSHVDSHENPADLASRGLHSKDLISNEMWWSGPSWLRISPCLWPITLSSHLDQNNLEAKQISCNFAYFHDYEDPLERFSTLDRAMRVMAYVFRFILRTRRTPGTQFNTTSIQTSEINYVRNRLIILSQKVFYAKEYRSLFLKKTVDKSSSVANLNPFLDSDDVMRVCGRLSNSESLSYDERHPIILPYNSLFSRLLLKFIHSITLHGGNMLMLRMLRLQFWISRAKNLIKTIIYQCKICVISKHKLQQQLMSALPPERTSISRPFTNTGLDFAGPFDIKTYTGRSRVITRGYVCIFICFSTRSIHLELTSDLSTPAFLASLHRFVSRRGCPANLYSDNGKNFVGASKELATNFLHCSRDTVTRHFEYQNITWHFIPPGAPHMGGLWEAGVKSFKLHFRKMAGNYKFTFEEFSTILSRIEACLNSRPISPISENPNDLLALTPGHFLVGGPLLSIAEPNEFETNLSIMNRWRRVRAISQQFNIRWKHEYLKELHKRNKWQRPEKNIAVKDMVVIRDECSPPSEWRLGRVSKLFPGKDGLVRVAEVVTQKGTITRPLVKLVLLPPC